MVDGSCLSFLQKNTLRLRKWKYHISKSKQGKTDAVVPADIPPHRELRRFESGSQSVAEKFEYWTEFGDLPIPDTKSTGFKLLLA